MFLTFSYFPPFPKYSCFFDSPQMPSFFIRAENDRLIVWVPSICDDDADSGNDDEDTGDDEDAIDDTFEHFSVPCGFPRAASRISGCDRPIPRLRHGSRRLVILQHCARGWQPLRLQRALRAFPRNICTKTRNSRVLRNRIRSRAFDILLRDNRPK